MTDRQILDDYVSWSTTRELDTSITAFLDERKAGEDALRIEQALDVIGYATNFYNPKHEMDNDAGHKAIARLLEVRGILIDDRPTIDEGTLTERRTVLA